MFCSQCGEKILGKPIRQGSEYYCSLECANLASGFEAEETEEYFEEDSLEEYFNEDE
ncbi:MAG: hypothetical protein ACOYVF_07665 [Candidatus Zixiibacteriota bacterium]